MMGKASAQNRICHWNLYGLSLERQLQSPLSPFITVFLYTSAWASLCLLQRHTLGWRKTERLSLNFWGKLLPGARRGKQDTLGAADWRLLRSTPQRASKLHATGHTKSPNLFGGPPAGYYYLSWQPTATSKGQYRRKKSITCWLASTCFASLFANWAKDCVVYSV